MRSARETARFPGAQLIRRAAQVGWLVCAEAAQHTDESGRLRAEQTMLTSSGSHASARSSVLTLVKCGFLDKVTND